MSDHIYFDHAATTEMLPQVKEVMEPYLSYEFGNASTEYEIGKKAKKAIEQAREKIAFCIDAKPQEIFFTSGGTESDNWAVKGIAFQKKQKGNIITSSIEHHAILNSCEYLRQNGYPVRYLKVDENGKVKLDDLEQQIDHFTLLISVMYANNEIGTIEPIWEIAKIAKSKGITFHTDAVQAIGQIPISVKKMEIDLLSASAHKFNGPKGIGFLFVRDGVDLPSFVHGGGQESGKRAGTENVAAIVGMAEALTIANKTMRVRSRYEISLRNYFMERVMREIPNVKLNGHPYQRLPGNINFSFKEIDATSLLTLLQEDGICASAGSACTTGKTTFSHVIEAINVPKEYAVGTIRFSLGAENTRREVDQTINSLKKNIAILNGG